MNFDPQYDERLFIEFSEKYCHECQNKNKKPIFVNIKQHVVNLYFSENSNEQSLVICGLTDARMRAFEKDLPVHNLFDFKKSLPNISTFSYSCLSR